VEHARYSPLCPFCCQFGKFWLTLLPRPHPNLLAGTLLGAMACAWHVPYSNGF